MSQSSNRDLLLSEYLKLQEIVEQFDQKSLAIKTWSVSLSAAGIVTALVEDSHSILLVAASSAIVFWIVEGLWKANQQAFYPRIYSIERALADGDDISPLQIATSWSKSWHARKGAGSLLTLLFWPHVLLPHIIVAVAGASIYFLMPPASGI